MKHYEISISLKAARILSYSAAAREAGDMQRLIPIADIDIQLSTGETKSVSRTWFGQTIPAVGGYLLELDDGALGYMPGAIFEAIFPVEKEEPVSTIIDV